MIRPVPSHDPARHRTWFVPSLLLLLGTAGLGAALYAGMPDPVPVHWNGMGAADAFAAKSPVAVFSPLMTGTGVVVVLWLLHRFLPSHPVQSGGQDPEAAAAGAAAGRHILAALSPALALLFSWLSLQGWLGLTGPAVIWVPMLALMAYAMVIIVRAFRYVAASAPPR